MEENYVTVTLRVVKISKLHFRSLWEYFDAAPLASDLGYCSNLFVLSHEWQRCDIREAA